MPCPLCGSVTSVGSPDEPIRLGAIAPRPLQGNPGNQDTAGQLWGAAAAGVKQGCPAPVPTLLGVSPRFCVCAGRGEEGVLEGGIGSGGGQQNRAPGGHRHPTFFPLGRAPPGGEDGASEEAPRPAELPSG